MRGIKNASQLGEAWDLRGLPNFEPASQCLNCFDSVSITYVLPYSIASISLRLIALLSVVRCTPHSRLSSAMVFMELLVPYLISYSLSFIGLCANNVLWLFKAMRMRQNTPILKMLHDLRALASRSLNARLSFLRINKIITLFVNYLIKMLRHVLDLTFSISSYPLGTLLVYSTYVEKSSLFPINIQHFEKLMEVQLS